MFYGFKKGALVASLFFVLSLYFAYANTETRFDRWYQIGYDYSQMGRNDDAFLWMLKAAEGDHVVAQNNIGLSYLHGLGAKKDNNKAFYWFNKAANQGLPYAQSELAMLYYKGKGVKKDDIKAKQWWMNAAKQEDEYAQFNLASLFLEEGDIKQAYYWFNRASKNNHPHADHAIELLNKEYVE